MQQFTHKLTSLSQVQKFFIEKTIELLYRGTIDSYRVKVKNPKTILQELKYCLECFEKKQVTSFISIVAKNDKGTNQYALKDEVYSLLEAEPNSTWCSRVFPKSFF